MKRPSTVLIAALGGLSTAAFAAEALPPIEIGDWTYAGAAETTIMFVKPDDPPGDSPYLRLLVRFEESTPFERRGFASMSNVELNDIDCVGRRTRILRNTRYPERNMRGEPHAEPVETPSWRVEEKGSFGDAILTAACEHTAPGDAI